jgi:hypothetical protein
MLDCKTSGAVKQKRYEKVGGSPSILVPGRAEIPGGDFLWHQAFSETKLCVVPGRAEIPGGDFLWHQAFSETKVCVVPGRGLEPPRVAPLAPKASASTNFAIPARRCKNVL